MTQSWTKQQTYEFLTEKKENFNIFIEQIAKAQGIAKFDGFVSQIKGCTLQQFLFFCEKYVKPHAKNLDDKMSELLATHQVDKNNIDALDYDKFKRYMLLFSGEL